MLDVRSDAAEDQPEDALVSEPPVVRIYGGGVLIGEMLRADTLQGNDEARARKALLNRLRRRRKKPFLVPSAAAFAALSALKSSYQAIEIIDPVLGAGKVGQLERFQIREIASRRAARARHRQ